MSIHDLRSIDLHMHSKVSDGTDTPEELIHHVARAGLDLFALTDHDAIHGCRRVIAARQEGDPRFLTGVEFSCEDEGGSYHILGYGYNTASEPIEAAVEASHSLRMRKVTARLEGLTEIFGFEFPAEEIEALLANDNPGKPHIGNLMAKLGYAETKEDAIINYINKVPIGLTHISPEVAVEGILGSGGIPILAHPTYGDGDDLITGDDMVNRLYHLMNLGIQGVEAYYSGFTKQMRLEMLSFADRYGLLVTAGSDYHGTNKSIRLGYTGLEDLSSAHSGLFRFLERVEDRIY